MTLLSSAMVRSVALGAAIYLCCVATTRAQDTAAGDRAAGDSRPTSSEGNKQDSAPASRPTKSPGTAESQPDGKAAAGAKVGTEQPYSVSGSLSLSYRGRKTDDGNDEDLYGYLSLDGGKAELDEIAFHMLGRLTWDLDGDASNKGNPFGSLNDVGGDSVDVKLYEAYVDLSGSLAPDSLGMRRVRLGRQNVFAGFTYLMDGARVDFQPIESLGRMRIDVYGGVPEYLYESSRSEDWIVGADASFQPWTDGRVDIRYAHVEDKNEWVDHEVNDFASLGLRQQLTKDLRAAATWDTVDGATRDVNCRLYWDDTADDLSIRATYRYEATITSEYTTTYDPYFGVLGTSFAYHQFQLDGSKLFDTHFGIDGGVSGRFLNDDDREGPFNHEFVRGWLTLNSFRWPVDEIDLALTGEIWESSGDDTASLGGEITWHPTDKLRFGLGSYYSLFKHDLFIVAEREDVTTFFLKVRWLFADDFRCDARYEFETGDEGDFHTGTIGLTWTF